MDQIRTQVLRARRRLRTEVFLRRLGRCWFFAMLVAAAAIAAPKLVDAGIPPASWAASWLAGAIAAGLLAASVWTWTRSGSELDAAMEIDRRFGLKERVASTVSLSPEAAQSPAGRALAADALRAVSRVQISDRFQIRLDRKAWLPLGPAVIAAALAAIIEPRTAQSSAEAHGVALSAQQLKNAVEIARKPLAELQNKPPSPGLQDAQAAMLEVEKKLQNLANRKNVDRRKALAEFNDLAGQLAQRRERLGGQEALRRQFAGLKGLQRGPADKLAQSLQQGQWEVARQELQKLQTQLRGGKVDEATRRRLEQQLRQMQQRLAEASDRRQEAMENLKRQIEQQKHDGKLAEAGDLQQKLDKMIQHQKQSQQLQRMAQQLGAAEHSLQNGDGTAAADAMEQMMEQLEQLQQQTESQSAEAQWLDLAMDQLELAKNAMGCPECNGAGCAECQRAGHGDGDKRQIGAMQSAGQGRGIGKGRGGAGRQPEDVQAGFRDSRIRQQTGQGTAVVTGEAEGPTIRGDVREAAREEIEAQGSLEADPLVIEQLPRVQRENAEEYFTRLLEGE